MLEAALIFGCFSALLLVMAIIAWLKMGRTPLLRRLSGRVEPDSSQGLAAARLLFAAVGLSATAAMLALVARIFA